jgi:hypothetical protein
MEACVSDSDRTPVTSAKWIAPVDPVRSQSAGRQSQASVYQRSQRAGARKSRTTNTIRSIKRSGGMVHRRIVAARARVRKSSALAKRSGAS